LIASTCARAISSCGITKLPYTIFGA